MTENKILKLKFSARSEAAGKLTKQQSERLDHEIQTNPQPTESYEIRGAHTTEALMTKRPNSRNRTRCQRTNVFGCTSRIDWTILGQRRSSNVNTKRSALTRRARFGAERLRMSIW